MEKVLTAADTLRLWEITHASHEAVESRRQRGHIASCTGQPPSFPTIARHFAPVLQAPLEDEPLETPVPQGWLSDEGMGAHSPSKALPSRVLGSEGASAAQRSQPGTAALTPSKGGEHDAFFVATGLSTDTLSDSRPQSSGTAWDLQMASNLVVMMHNNAAGLDTLDRDENEDITVIISRSDPGNSPPRTAPAPEALAAADGQAGNGRVAQAAGALSENVPPPGATRDSRGPTQPGHGPAKGQSLATTSQGVGAGVRKPVSTFKAIAGGRGPSSPVRALSKATKDVRAVLETRQRNLTAEVAASLFKGERLLAVAGKPEAGGSSTVCPLACTTDVLIL
jgi:hypothetical protein